MAINRKAKFSIVLIAGALLIWFGLAQRRQARRLVERQEVHIVDLLRSGTENHVRQFGTRPQNWRELQGASEWATIETICHNYRVEHPTNLYIFLPKPVQLPGYQPREVWLIRKLPFNYNESRHGRWALGSSVGFPIRFWLEEAELPPALVEQLTQEDRRPR